MADTAPSFHVRLERPELANDLIGALSAGDCTCTLVDGETLLVVHRAAEDWREARTELRFFLDAWVARHGQPAVSLV